MTDPTQPTPLPPPPPPPGATGPTAGGGGGIHISGKALGIALVVVVLVFGVVAGAVVFGGGDDAAGAQEIGLEPIASAGTNPFMPAVGTDQPDVTPPPSSGGTYSGDLVGLYGGTLNTSSCDSQQLVTFLQQNPDKGSAWASVVGIRPADIPTYVSELTPVILRSDTYVTNHGFSNGRATTIPAVLQAGTAVLVDKYGTPVTKCYCGNPLSPPPRYSTPKYSGPRWSGFAPSSITIIQSTTTVINTYTLVDPVTGEPFVRPAGTNGGADVPSTPSTTLPTLPPVTAPPATLPPATAPGPSPEDRAIAKITAASSDCYPFPLPIQETTDGSASTRPGDDPSYFVAEVVNHTVTGETQVFTWHVDRDTLAFTPVTELAQVASDHCPGLR